MKRRRLLSRGLPAAALLGLVPLACAGDDSSTPAAFAPAGLDGGPITDATIAPAIPEEDVVGDHVRIPYDAGGPPGPARTPVHAEVVSTRADVQSLMFASGEMQISGEPFAQFFAGRNLNDYDRTAVPPDQYILGLGGPDPKPVIDLFGFSTAVESYEYSKMHMNMVANQTTAGLSLAVAPVVRKRAGATALDRLRSRTGELFFAAGADLAGYAQIPPPRDDAGAPNPFNYLGFTGIWPNFFPFKSFDPTMAPASQVVQSCTFAGGYGGIPTLNSLTPEFECAYNTLHLTDRESQVEKTLVPAVLGFATWKEALWSIDFAGRLHDAGSNPVDAVAEADEPRVGTQGNNVVARDPQGAVAGTFLGSTPLEDVWGLSMLEEMDNAAEFLIARFTTTDDGTVLGGFATKADALAYDYTSKLRWFPSAVTVTEDGAVPYQDIASLAISSGTSRSIDLGALLVGYAMFFGETDARNAGIGQRVGLRLTFDGDPFPRDDGAPDGEETAHDRALAVLRVAMVNLDRMHFVPLASASGTSGAGVTVDTSTVVAGVPRPGTEVTTTTLAHVVIGLRQALLSLNGAITQYGASDPDPGADARGILNVPALHPTAPGAATTVSARLRQMIVANGTFVRDVLTKADGTVANGATITAATGGPATDASTLESQSAAARALTEVFLVTGDTSFRDRARAVVTRLQTDFYSAPARLYRGVLGGGDDVSMTPERFGWLQSALREAHKVLHVEGDPALGRAVLEDRIARVNKLFLNGWDDLDGNQSIDTKTECLGGRLQQGEQALTGELGLDDFGLLTIDRDHDCVLDIARAGVGSVLASEVHFHSP